MSQKGKRHGRRGQKEKYFRQIAEQNRFEERRKQIDEAKRHKQEKKRMMRESVVWSNDTIDNDSCVVFISSCVVAT